MNLMISSEVPLYIALAVAGVCGYVFVQWASIAFCPKRARTCTTKAEMLAVDEVKRVPAALPKGLKPRSSARGRPTGMLAHCATTTPKAQLEATKPSMNQEAVAEKLLATEATQLKRELAVESERVLRLLAKKAERKARKAQEGLQEQACTEASQVVEAAPSEQANPFTSEQSSVDSCAGAQLEDLSMAAEPPTGITSGSPPGSQKPFDENFVCQDVNVAELSTGDETFMCQGRPEETGEESSEEDVAIGVLDVESPDVEQSPCTWDFPPPRGNFESAVWTCDEEFQGLYNPVAYDDAWMAPLDDVIRSHGDAEQVYTEVLAGMCASAGVALVPETLYQPVLCDGNQQLYTDGEQLYVLACVDVSADMDMSAPRSMRPVVDAHDPLHMEFARDCQQGLLPCVGSHAQTPPESSDLLWDACWEFAS